MVTGKAAHIMMVIAAWSQMDDPTKSAVVDKVEFAPTPHVPGVPPGPGLGHWLGGVARTCRTTASAATVEFLRWFQTKEAQIATAKAGGIPISAAAYRDPIAEERQFRWMKPLAEALPHAVNIYQFPEASEVIAILELGLNRAIAGEITVDAGAERHGGRDPRRDGQVQLQDRQARAAALKRGERDEWRAALAAAQSPTACPARALGVARGARSGRRASWRWVTFGPALALMLALERAAARQPVLDELLQRHLGRTGRRPGRRSASRTTARSAGDPLFRAGLVNTIVFALARRRRADGARLLRSRCCAAASTRGRVLYRAIFILPILIPGIVIGAIWKLMLNYDFGLVNQVIGLVGLEPHDWLGDAETALLSVIVVDIWHWTPFCFLLFLAGLESLPQDVYEAAQDRRRDAPGRSSSTSPCR